jgi:UDP-N-acetylmuramoyl-tripeptide--D-alanyl-D-alanine ligase
MSVLIFVSYVFFSARRLLTYLHFFQQDEYDSPRFIRWVLRTVSIDRRATLCLLIIDSIYLAGFMSSKMTSVLAAISLAGLGLFEKDPRVKAKKRLSMTGRATRIYVSSLIIGIGVGLALVLTKAHILFWPVAIQVIPLFLVFGNLVLMPYERRVQQRYWDEAHRKLLAIKPITIGITGSYGKTSVKHILGHILSNTAPTLITPASVNTPMGVSRIVREQMNADHHFFVCEMGAYGPGSIRRMCDLASPDLGIITAIGAAHYERFKTLETVAKAKFELAEAVVGKKGIVVLTEEVANFANAIEFVSRHRKNVLIVGRGQTSDLRIISSDATIAGIQLDVEWKGARFVLRSPLYGLHHGVNMAVAFAAACELGVAPEDAVLGLASTPQISHRLEVRRHPCGAVLIDDAYNSNPVGFGNALTLLDLLRQDGGRRILITPGMVEMGQIHDEEHRKIGALAAAHVDVLLPVVPQRIQPLITAFQTVNLRGEVVLCGNFKAAETWLASNCRSTDTVLIENDLPDLYESRPSL